MKRVHHIFTPMLNNQFTEVQLYDAAELRDALIALLETDRDPITQRFVGKAAAGRLLDGKTHDAFPGTNEGHQ